MQLRCCYRLYPDESQRQALAQAFGNARVVYNDAVRARQDAHAAGEKFPSGTVLQKRLITDAKHTDERGWLAECSNIVLQQAIRDCDAAYRNFFDSLKGKRAGRRVGTPRFKSKRDRWQAVGSAHLVLPVWSGARPRHQRSTKHPRRRTGGEAKRLWRRRKTPHRGGCCGSRKQRNPARERRSARGIAASESPPFTAGSTSTTSAAAAWPGGEGLVVLDTEVSWSFPWGRVRRGHAPTGFHASCSERSPAHSVWNTPSRSVRR